MKILTIDDSEFERQIMRDLLNSSGYSDVIEAKDGEEGLQRYLEDRPDLVLLDLTMPGMSGIEVLTEIRKKDPNAKVVIISMTSDKELKEQALEQGANDFITKPLDDKLIDGIRKLES